MGWLWLARTEVLKMIKLGGEIVGHIGNRCLYSRTQGIWVALSKQVDNELPTFNRAIEIRREFRHKVIADQVNDGHMASES